MYIGSCVSSTDKVNQCLHQELKHSIPDVSESGYFFCTDERTLQFKTRSSFWHTRGMRFQVTQLTVIPNLTHLIQLQNQLEGNGHLLQKSGFIPKFRYLLLTLHLTISLLVNCIYCRTAEEVGSPGSQLCLQGCRLRAAP